MFPMLLCGDQKIHRLIFYRDRLGENQLLVIDQAARSVHLVTINAFVNRPF